MKPSTLFTAYAVAAISSEAATSSCPSPSTISSVVISTVSSTATLYLEQGTSFSTATALPGVASSDAPVKSNSATAGATATSTQFDIQTGGTGSSSHASASTSMAVFTGSAPASGVGYTLVLTFLEFVLLLGYL